MKTWVRKTLSVGVLAAGALLLVPAAAQAGVSQGTSDNNGIANGTQLVAPVSVPVNVIGNAIGVAGEANAAGAGWNEGWTEGVRQGSSDNNGIGNGTQAYLPVHIPVNVAGNAAGVLGEGNAAAVSRNESGTAAGGAHQGSSDNNGIANGTQIYSPVDVPINICGNSLALLGQANAVAVCTNNGSGGSGAARQHTSDNNGIGNGTQVYAPVSLPVNLSGNAIGVVGEANAAAVSSNESGRAAGGGRQGSSDNAGIANGTQISAPVHVPVNVCGNALSILGEANAMAACANGGHDHHGGDNGGDHGNDDPATGADDDDTDYSRPARDRGRPADARTKSVTEQSPASDVTDRLSGVGAAGLGGITLLDTLR